MLRTLTRVGAVLAAAGTVHAAANLRLLRRPPSQPPPVTERVSVLVPARDEQDRIAGCLRGVVAQRGLRDVEIVVLDDASRDATLAVVRDVVGDDPRVRVLAGSGDPPRGWLGKPWACARLAEAATGDVLVLVDADVVLEPHAVAATVTLLRWSGLDLVSPYPRQRCETVAERLVQPLLQWSWATTLPLRIAERSRRPSLTAANGQLLAVDAGAYRRAGGFAAVRGEVLDDIALARAVKAAGGAGGVVDGSALATCRMYDGWRSLRDGYTKSLWSATGSPAGATAVGALLATVYVLPPLAALRGSRAGLVGYAAAVAGRVVVARRTRGRAVPDAFAHPGSVVVLLALTARSWRQKRRGALTWRGRPVG